MYFITASICKKKYFKIFQNSQYKDINGSIKAIYFEVPTILEHVSYSFKEQENIQFDKI